VHRNCKKRNKIEDVYWLNRELYGAEEWVSTIGTEKRNLIDDHIFPDYRKIKSTVFMVFTFPAGREEETKMEYPMF